MRTEVGYHGWRAMGQPETLGVMITEGAPPGGALEPNADEEPLVTGIVWDS